MGESENIIARERILGVFGEDEGSYEIAGDNGIKYMNVKAG